MGISDTKKPTSTSSNSWHIFEGRLKAQSKGPADKNHTEAIIYSLEDSLKLTPKENILHVRQFDDCLKRQNTWRPKSQNSTMTQRSCNYLMEKTNDKKAYENQSRSSSIIIFVVFGIWK